MAQVVIAGWMDYPARRDEVLTSMRTMTELTRREPGCLGYVFSADVENPDRIQVFERWATQEALDAHLATQHVSEFRASIAHITRSGRELHVFRVADVHSM